MVKITFSDLNAMEERLSAALPNGAAGPLGEVVKDHQTLIDVTRSLLVDRMPNY